MSIRITTIDAEEADDWNDYVAKSPHSVPFHRYEALERFADLAGTTLHPLVGYKGEEPVGILPLFESTTGPLRQIRSPPDAEAYCLGPALLNFEKLTQRKAERRHTAFVEGCLDWVDETFDPDAVDIRTTHHYDDVRPFTWQGYDVAPAYTYLIDLSPDEESVLEGFSRDARSNITDTPADAYTIEENGVAGTRTVIEQIQHRHEHQANEYELTPTFAADLFDALPEGTMRSFVLSAGGEPKGGIVTVETDDTIARWQGGAKPDSGVDLPVNDLLDWHIMRTAMDRGFSQYNLVGANLPRLCKYKAKFNPTPVPYYVARRCSTRMRAAAGLYQRLPDRLRVL